MKFIVNDEAIEAASLDKITGRDAMELTKQVGFGLSTVARLLGELSGDSAVDPMDSADHMRALFALIWLSRRLNGDKVITFDESCDFPLSTFTIELDDDEQEEETVDPNPTQVASEVADAVAV
jgi:hypothetical protein